MKTRVLFGIAGFTFVLLSLYVFPPVFLAICLSILSSFATFELITPTKLVNNRIVICISSVCALIFGIVNCVIPIFFKIEISIILTAILIICLVILLFIMLLKYHEFLDFSQISNAFFASIIIPAMLLSLWRIFLMKGGQFLVLMPLVAAWGSDTCALFAGMAFGKHKLAPVISPKKTIEGAVGGIIGATILMIVVAFIFNTYAGLKIHYVVAAILGALGAVVGQVGDLSFSIIKRQTNIKDYSHIFPGHGGVLDRFDSVIFVAPLAEIILRVFGVS